MDEVFRALADENRRRILDLLAARDGRTLIDLQDDFPDLTRFGVMNHLRVLAAAGLVTTRKQGRFTLHYLNPVPIRQVADRWISTFTAPVAGALTHLKRSLEEQAMTASISTPQHVATVVINATPERVWQGLTDPEYTRQYFFGSAIRSELTVGSRFDYYADEDVVLLAGEILEIDPPRRLVTTFDARWDEDVIGDPPSRVTFELQPLGEAGTATKLTVVQDGFTGQTATADQVADGLPLIVSGLKTLLETGAPLRVE